jgi:hypothetical protein
MAAKHTPGPWTAGSEGDATGEIVGPHMVYVASVATIVDFPCIEDDERPAVEAECRANAALIAAAPELYEALRSESEMLEALILDLRHLPEPFSPGPRLGRMLDIAKAARAALAKAEGREVSP